MQFSDTLSLQQIQSIFADEISDHGGAVRDAFCHEGRLFARSILKPTAEIKRRDRIQGGVALCATDESISVHPYTFRLVCSNGAIHAQAIETRLIVQADCFGPDHVERTVRETIAMCCAPEVFEISANQMRDAATAQIDMMLMMSSMLSRLPREMMGRMMEQMLSHLESSRTRTRYDLMNAVTATARDTRDPGAKWELEKLGGEIAAGLVPAEAGPAFQRLSRAEALLTA